MREKLVNWLGWTYGISLNKNEREGKLRGKETRKRMKTGKTEYG